MIMVYPHNEDWDDIATLTGDASWRRRQYADILPEARELSVQTESSARSPMLGIDPSRHGFDGWLDTEISIPKAVLGDFELEAALKVSLAGAVPDAPSLGKRLEWLVAGQGDPNDWRLVGEDAFGVHYPPLRRATIAASARASGSSRHKRNIPGI